jgi:hypothetical protein
LWPRPIVMSLFKMQVAPTNMVLGRSGWHLWTVGLKTRLRSQQTGTPAKQQHRKRWECKQHVLAGQGSSCATGCCCCWVYCCRSSATGCARLIWATFDDRIVYAQAMQANSAASSCYTA